MPITGLYALLLVPLYVFLTLRVVMQRRDSSVSLGDGGDAKLLRRIRVHANFVETAPFALVLILLAESLKASRPLLHLAGVALILGRYLHAYGTGSDPQVMSLRALGMVLTLAAAVVAAILVLIQIVPYYV